LVSARGLYRGAAVGASNRIAESDALAAGASSDDALVSPTATGE